MGRLGRASLNRRLVQRGPVECVSRILWQARTLHWRESATLCSSTASSLLAGCRALSSSWPAPSWTGVLHSMAGVSL